MTSIYCGMCGTMVPDGGHPCYARQQVQTTDYPSSHGVTQYLPPSCKNSTAHYQGCECHEESWKQRLDLERQEILELRAEIEAREKAASIGPWFEDENHISSDNDIICDFISASENRQFIARCRQDIPFLLQALNRYKDALERIADPRKRTHKEPDAYTTLGCVMNMAEQALAEVERMTGEK